MHPVVAGDRVAGGKADGVESYKVWTAFSNLLLYFLQFYGAVLKQLVRYNGLLLLSEFPPLCGNLASP